MEKCETVSLQELSLDFELSVVRPLQLLSNKVHGCIHHRELP